MTQLGRLSPRSFALAVFAGVLIPGVAWSQITNAEYASRRAALAALAGDGQSIVVAMGTSEPPEDYIAFYQNSPFRYLTGFMEPNAALLLLVRDGEFEGEFLFVNPRNPADETWEGHRVGPSGVEVATGIRGRSLDDLKTVFDSLRRAGWQGVHTVGYDARTAVKNDVAQRVEQLLSGGPGSGVGITRPLDRQLNELRGLKSPAEIDLLERAAEITAQAQREIMGAAAPGMNEFELQALLEYTFRRYGSERPSFSTIVGSGPNSTILHYNANDRFMEDGDLVVADIGASYGGYAADVTRTFPVNGRFSDEQRAIYQIVRDAQQAAEDMAGPGVTQRDLSQRATTVLAEGLVRLGLMESLNASYVDESGTRIPQYFLFYMHALGHGLGLDVHDPWPSTLVPGVPFTIEPGIYVRANLLTEIIPDVPQNRSYREALASVLPRYVNIGVRIEDDYVVTSSGADWISRAPREIAEVEALMAQPWSGPAARDGSWVEWYRDFQ